MSHWVAGTLIAVIAAGSALAQSTTTSASFELLSAPAGENAGGGPVTGSGGIVAEISTGEAVSGVVSNVSGSGFQKKGNLVGQLYDMVDLAVTSSPATVDEGGTRQMVAEATMDDATTLAVDAGEVAWSESSAALTGVDAGGLVSAGIVYENTVANVGGTYLGIADGDGFDLTVVNVGVDDFGIYAGDGVDDDWQVGFFGESDPEGVGGANKDGDPDTNFREFLGGFDPTAATDFLQFTVTGKTGSVVDFLLNKAIPGRTYRLMESSDLVTAFTEVGNFSVGSEETAKAVQDTGAPAGSNFYRVEISKP